MLACAKLGIQLKDYVGLIGPGIAHLHIADASGTDREGQQIADGKVNFALLARQLKRLAPDASFIPEIWQGHIGGGQGFWTALERLEPIFGAADNAGAATAQRRSNRGVKPRRSRRGVRNARSHSH